MKIRVNTGIAFYPLRKIGAYAFWIVAGPVRIREAGPIKQVETAAIAEWILMAKLLSALLEIHFEAITVIVIICGDEVYDSVSAGGSPSPIDQRWRSLLRDLKQKNTLAEWEFRRRTDDVGGGVGKEWCQRSTKEIVVDLMNGDQNLK